MEVEEITAKEEQIDINRRSAGFVGYVGCTSRFCGHYPSLLLCSAALQAQNGVRL
jgi:hypothetical protein